MVWYIYLDEWLIFRVNVGKCGIFRLNVGKYTIVPWIRNGNFNQEVVRKRLNCCEGQKNVLS